MKASFSIFFIILLFTSCIGTKYLKPGENILYNQGIKSTGNLDKDALQRLLEQKANKKLVDTRLIWLDITLPIAHRVYIYNWGKKHFDSTDLLRKRKKISNKYNRKIEKANSASRESRLKKKRQQKIEKINTRLREGNLRMRWGEQLAVFDSNAVNISKRNLKAYLFSKGYFDAEIEADIEKEGRLVEVTYTIFQKKPYIIDSILYIVKDKNAKELLMKHRDANLLKGKRYDEGLITEERNRTFELMVNNGYYGFKRQYIHFEVDSTILDNKRLVVRKTVVNPPGQQRHKLFKVDSVIFTTGSGVRQSREHRIETYNDVTYDFSSDRYPERLLDWRIFIEKDSLYQKNLTLQTQRQLSYLDVFKFVNINYDSTGGKFIANIFTSPLKKFQTSTEVGLSVLDQAGYPGPFVNFNAKSRNFFKGLEIIQFDGNASIVGISNVRDRDDNYTRLQYGGQLSVTFPQFLFPLKNSVRKRIGRFNPRTKFASGLNFEDRRDEYERTTLYGNISYIWQVKNNTQFTLKPTDLSYIWAVNSVAFEEDLSKLPRSLASAFEPSFVSFSSIAVDHKKNNYGIANLDASLIRSYFETGGNLLAVVGDQPFGSGLEYYRYLKTNVDYRKNERINESTALAYRVNVGAALSYGKNHALPYEKYFFAGGSNSIRAWEPRRLGPGAFGTYVEPNDRGQIVVSDTLERPGDILLELSLEFRKDLAGFVEYALFIDAGNTWLWKSNTIVAEDDAYGESEDGPKDDGVFKLRTFPREIAVGAGFGLRFDFSFLLLRLDAAYKIVDPAYPLGERFILGGYNFQDLWNSDKMTLNIGIGYPF